MMSSVCWARFSLLVKAMSKRSPSALSTRPAQTASIKPLSVRSGLRMPVKMFFLFHSLSPWRTSTSVFDMAAIRFVLCKFDI